MRAARRTEGRREERHAAACRASAKLSFSIQLRDASHGGMRAECSVVLPVGSTLKVTLPGAIECHARIVWSDGEAIGCEFLRPLSDAQLSAVLSALPHAEPARLR